MQDFQTFFNTIANKWIPVRATDRGFCKIVTAAICQNRATWTKPSRSTHVGLVQACSWLEKTAVKVIFSTCVSVVWIGFLWNHVIYLNQPVLMYRPMLANRKRHSCKLWPHGHLCLCCDRRDKESGNIVWLCFCKRRNDPSLQMKMPRHQLVQKICRLITVQCRRGQC